MSGFMRAFLQQERTAHECGKNIEAGGQNDRTELEDRDPAAFFWGTDGLRQVGGIACCRVVNPLRISLRPRIQLKGSFV